MTDREAAALRLVGPVIVVGLGLYLASQLRPRLLEYRPGIEPSPIPPPAPFPPEPGPAPAPAALGRVLADRIPLEAGGRYMASIDVNGALSLLASSAKVKAQAEKMGFQDVTVTDAKPASWPSVAKGDYYVEGTFAGASGTLVDRTNAGGRVVVEDAIRVA